MAPWAPPGHVLFALGALVNAFRALLGALGRPWDTLGALLGRSWDALGALGKLLGASWAQLGKTVEGNLFFGTQFGASNGTFLAFLVFRNHGVNNILNMWLEPNYPSDFHSKAKTSVF